jgi:glycosyltransferase involved in cell wall biosynthesis
MPRISVIIPTYNRADMLTRAVESVLAQTYTDFELIVVDDGSDDDTADRLDAFKDRISIIRQERQGVSAARNAGIAAAIGDLLAFLDSDDQWLPEKLAVQVEFFDQSPNAMICQTEEIWIRNGRRVNPKNRHQKPSGDIFEPSLHLCLVSPSAVMMRRKLFDLVGLFDENLPACEDYDLWLRASARLPVYLIDSPLIIKYGGHDDQLSRTIPGLDQYRVMSLEKILKADNLPQGKADAARRVLIQKAEIYGQGCIKRGRLKEGEHFLSLARQYSES